MPEEELTRLHQSSTRAADAESKWGTDFSVLPAEHVAQLVSLNLTFSHVSQLTVNTPKIFSASLKRKTKCKCGGFAELADLQTHKVRLIQQLRRFADWPCRLSLSF